MGSKKSGDKPEPTLELPSLRLPRPGGNSRRRRRPVERSANALRPTRPRPRRRDGNRARVPALAALLVTGVLVGLAGTGAAYGGLRACDATRGTPSCGESGLLALVAIVVVMVVLGAALLRLSGIPEPWGVSLLGVGLVCVVVLLTPMERLVSPWAFLAAPALTALGFAAGRWVTTRFVEPADEGPAYDVR